MPIATDTGKLAIMELDADWEPGLPLLPASLDQAARQQLIWGFPEVLWGVATPDYDRDIATSGFTWQTFEAHGYTWRTITAEGES